MRVGLLIILFGLAIIGATLASDSINWGDFGRSFDISPGGQIAVTFYPIRRTANVIVESSVDFRGKLYILDATRIKQWLDEGVFEPIATFDVFGGLSTVFQPANRGFYAFIVYNDLNETRLVSIRCTEYGFEYDLLIAANILLVIGSAFLLSSVIMMAFSHKNVNMQETKLNAIKIMFEYKRSYAAGGT
jgi:hypothetical protein